MSPSLLNYTSQTVTPLRRRNIEMADQRSYGLELLEFLDAAPAAKLLPDGEVLVRQHDHGSDVFVVLDGAMEASIESEGTDAMVGRFQRGQLFGELTAISGGPRTATVRAAGTCSVAVVPRDEFLAWLDANPGHYEAVAELARDRVDRNRAAAMLARLFGSDNEDVLGEVLPMVQWRTLEPEEVLCNEGDPSDSAYLILSGRVGVTSDRRIGTMRRVELGRNQIVGELGVLDRLPRTATVTALRRTSLAELPAAAVQRIISKYPEVAINLFRQALGRALHPKPRSDQATAVGLVFANTHLNDRFVEIAESELARHGSVIVLDSAAVDNLLTRDGAAQSPSGSVGGSRVNALIHDLESSHDYVLLVGDPDATEWTLRIAETADRTMVAASAVPQADELEILERIEARLDRHRLPWWRIIIHRARATNPARHRPAAQAGERVLHARKGHEGDIRRAIRLLSGNGIGLALGGGGARGFGHIGAYRALTEAGIEPDVVSGASIGSVFGAAIALDWDPLRMETLAKEAFADLLDWTVPIVSFLKGERITKNISKAYSEYECQALWRPFCCVVTNLTQSCIEVRDSGPLDRAVRMSVSIPGVLPPMSDEGEVFVDGGVLNNLPADVVAMDPSVRTVFAIDVAPPVGPRVDQAIDSSVSGFSLLAGKARGRKIFHPSAASIVMQTMVAASGRDRRMLLEDGTIDHYMHLKIRGSSLLAFDNVEPVVLQGYESAKEQLDELFPDGFRTS